jgi:hypothetical protein
MSNKTTGGLVIQPSVHCFETDKEGNISFTSRNIVNHVDNIFNHPGWFSFDFIDTKKELHQITTGQLEYRPVRVGRLINLTVPSDDSDLGKPVPIKSTLGYTATSNITGPSYQPASLYVLFPEDTNNLFTNLAKQAAERIATGKVQESDIIDNIHEDTGVSTKPDNFVTATQSIKELKQGKIQREDGTAIEIVNALKEMHTNPDMKFIDVVNRIMSPNDNYTKKTVKSTSLLSAVVSGIGGNHFLTAYLDAYENMAGGKGEFGVDDFLGGEMPISDDLTSRIIKSLNIGSEYHTRLVKNYYKNACAGRNYVEY